MGIDNKTLAAAKSYVKKSMQGAGAIQGQKGDPGKDGKDAPTITNINVDESNVLSVTLSDGNTLTGGKIQTLSGKDGITPHIDPTTKHWFIGTTDTGIVAEGKDDIVTPGMVQTAVNNYMVENPINYDDIDDKPTINGAELSGNLTLDDIGVTTVTEDDNIDFSDFF